MNKAFVHVMVDATWIWDATLSRMDWANKEGLEFIGIKSLSDLQKIRYNEDLPWVYQLNRLSKEGLPLKGTMEKISFPGDVVLNCWVKNHEIEEGHPGLWIILKEDHKLEQSYKNIEPNIIPSLTSQEPAQSVIKDTITTDTAADNAATQNAVTPHTVAKSDEDGAEKENSPVMKRPDFLVAKTISKQEMPLQEHTEEQVALSPTENKSDVEIKLKPTTIVQDNDEKKPVGGADIEEKNAVSARENRKESNKILALIARQINAKTGLSYGKRKSKPEQDKPVMTEPVIQPNIARSVSDYVGADKSAVASNQAQTPATPKEETSKEKGKVALPGMAELMKQMKHAGELTTAPQKDDITPANTDNFEAEPLENMPLPLSDVETKNSVQSVSNSEGIHAVKRVSEKEELLQAPQEPQEKSDSKMSVVAEFMEREAQSKGNKPVKASAPVKTEAGIKQKRETKAVNTAKPEPKKAVVKAQSKQGKNKVDDGNDMGAAQQSDPNMHEFPVASAMANKQGEFIAASELFSLAMGYRDEAEFLKEAQFKTILPAIYNALVKGEGSRGATNFFENSAGLTKSGRRMKLSLSAKTSTTKQGKTHFMVLYPTGVAFPKQSEEQSETIAPQADIIPASIPASISTPVAVNAANGTTEKEAKDSIKGADGSGIRAADGSIIKEAEGSNIKDDYERTLPFLAKISHEIRTPLNSIIGFSEIMKEEQFGPVENERYLGYMEDIFVSANHALSLVNDMLDISRIQAGSMEIERETLDLNSHVQSAIKSMAPQFAQKDIHVWQGLSEHKLSIFCDKRSLRQIVLNLVSNAVKYTPQGGQITISTALEKNGQVVLRVRDTGIGMSESDIKQAMKPFQRLDTILRHETNGSGLGLPLTKALIEANKAMFKVESAVDKGTVASVIFPQ